MDFTFAGTGPVRTVVILGAGASYDEATRQGLLCPLDRTFLADLELNPVHPATISREVIRSVRNRFGATTNVGIEEYFLHLEARRELTAIFDSGSWAADVNRVEEERRNLVEVLKATLRPVSVLMEDRYGRDNQHRVLAQKLQSEDTVISFNYDFLVDRSLFDVGGPNLYGLGNNPFWDALSSEVKVALSNSGQMKPRLRLLKLHGSLLFSAKEDNRSIEISVHHPTSAPDEPFLVLPGISKSFTKSPEMKGIWQEAITRLTKAEAVIVIGYSAPATDLHSINLLQYPTSRRRVRFLFVVNPNQEDSDRVARLIQRGGVTDEFIYRRFDNMEQLFNRI